MTPDINRFKLTCEAAATFMNDAFGHRTFKVIEMSMQEMATEALASDSLGLQMRYLQLGFLVAEGRQAIEEAAALGRAAAKAQDAKKSHQFLKFVKGELSTAKNQETLIADRRKKFAARFKKEGQEFALEERRRATDFADALLSDAQAEFGNSTRVLGINAELSALVVSRCNDFFSERLCELQKLLVRFVEDVSRQTNRNFPMLSVFPQNSKQDQLLELKQPSLRQTSEGILREIRSGQFNWSVLGLTSLGRWMGALDATRAFRVDYARTQRPAISTFLRDSRNAYAKLVSGTLERFGKYLSGNIQSLVECTACRADELEQLSNGEIVKQDYEALLQQCDDLERLCGAAYGELVTSREKQVNDQREA